MGLEKVWIVTIEGDEENSPFLFSTLEKALQFCRDRITNDEWLWDKEKKWALKELERNSSQNPNEFSVDLTLYCVAKEVA